MSILEVVEYWREQGRLILLEPAMPGTPTLRTRYVSSEINELLAGPWINLEWQTLFPAYLPFKGNGINDYISTNVLLV